MKQSQASLYAQLIQVRTLATKNGYYGAADFITEQINRIQNHQSPKLQGPFSAVYELPTNHPEKLSPLGKKEAA